MKLSICIPVYNGADTLEELMKDIDRDFKGQDFEVVMVNDGSRDNSAEVCRKIVETYPYARFVNLRRNFGEHNADMCALTYSTGDYAVIIDDDNQNPPAEIYKLLSEIEKGYDVVFAKYHHKKHNIFRNLGSKFNGMFATWVIGKPKDLYLCSFKIIRREVINEIIKYTGPFPYIDGLLFRVTTNVSSVYVEHKAREEGRSNYTLGKLIHLWLSMFVNFSIKPMRLIMAIGTGTMFLSVVLAVWCIADKIMHPETAAGWASLAVLILFFGGMQSLFLGLIGEYVGKNYLDQNKTPQFVVKETYGFTSEKNTVRQYSQKHHNSEKQEQEVQHQD